MSTPYSSAPSVKVRNSAAAAVLRPLSALSVWVANVIACSWLCRLRQPGHPREPADVDDQRHATVTHDRGARNPLDALVVGVEALDHDLLLADQLVDPDRDLASLRFHQDHRAGGLGPRLALHREDFAQREQRDVLAAHAQDLALAGDRLEVFGLGLQRF